MERSQISASVLETIKNRRSVRRYKDTPLTKEEVDKLLMAGLAAPSARNCQPWKIVVVTNQNTILEMENDIILYFKNLGDKEQLALRARANYKIFYDAPLVLMIPIDEGAFSLCDAGILIENIAIAATGMGLGSVILGLPRVLFDGDKADYWHQRLQFPESYKFGIAIAIGHGEGEGQPHEPDRSKIVYID